jgi:hypothetical protein
MLPKNNLSAMKMIKQVLVFVLTIRVLKQELPAAARPSETIALVERGSG